MGPTVSQIVYIELQVKSITAPVTVDLACKARKTTNSVAFTFTILNRYNFFYKGKKIEQSILILFVVKNLFFMVKISINQTEDSNFRK